MAEGGGMEEEGRRGMENEEEGKEVEKRKGNRGGGEIGRGWRLRKKKGKDIKEGMNGKKKKAK